MQFGVARGVEKDVTHRERSGVERVPVAINDAMPVVRADEVADVHVGYGVAVDLVGVVERVAEGNERSKKTIQGPEMTQPIRERGGLRRVEGHEAGRSSDGVSTIIADEPIRTAFKTLFPQKNL